MPMFTHAGLGRRLLLFAAVLWAAPTATWAGGAASDADLGPAAAARVPAAVDAVLLARIDAALDRSTAYLLKAQQPDGSWRSDMYGCFREGPTLTPYVMSCLFFLPRAGEPGRQAFSRGVDYLVGFVGPDDHIKTSPNGINFATYTAAMASRVVVLQEKSPEHRRAQQAWLNHLREQRLGPALGWTRTDREFGGWGFSMELPRKPAAGQPRRMLCESNLSATLFGLAALRSARIPFGDPVYDEVLVFVERCQNFNDNAAETEAAFDDGGFFFIPDDALQNKAGVAGTDRRGRTRFRSYGTMTADGLRALIQCGLPLDHPRVLAARLWLEQHFSVTDNPCGPGAFADDRVILRNATYYYWCWAAAHTLMHLGADTVRTQTGPVRWPEALATELLKRQNSDGTWTNHFTDAKEDDPMVSTPWAASALAICRRVMTGDEGTLAGKTHRQPG